MDVFVARQPIFDRNKNIYAYELLFRSGQTNAFPDIDGETATNSLLSSSFFTIGIEKICAGRPAFINFPQKLVENGTPKFFPPEKMTVEVLEDVVVTSRLIQECQELKRAGFQLALDDFACHKNLEELLSLADIIKFDFRITPAEELTAMLEKLSAYKFRLLAEKVENYEDFQFAKDLGFHYFQGYFFSKPDILKSRELESSQLTTLQLLNAINSEEELDIEQLEQILSRDVSITNKLITYINSPQFGRLEPISNIRQAIAFLGEREIRLFVNVIGTTNLSKEKPRELICMALIRARFLQKLGEAKKQNSKKLFLLGLFSLIDAMLDQSMESLVKKLALSTELNDALIHRKGDMGVYLRLIECYESGNWMQFRYAKKRLALEDELLANSYVHAIEWTNVITDNL